MACPSTPPCWKPKDHDLVNLDCDIAPGRVSFQHPLESCRSKCGRPPVRLERIVLAFNESKRDGHDGMVRAAVAGGGWPQIPPRSQRKTNPAKCGVLPFGAPDSGGIGGGTDAVRTRLLIVSRASSGEGSTGVRHAASPMSRPRHARLIGESQGDTSARCAPLPCPSGASATNPWAAGDSFGSSLVPLSTSRGRCCPCRRRGQVRFDAS